MLGVKRDQRNVSKVAGDEPGSKLTIQPYKKGKLSSSRGNLFQEISTPGKENRSRNNCKACCFFARESGKWLRLGPEVGLISGV